MSLIYFDSNVCIGKRGLKDHREIWKSEDVLAAMDSGGYPTYLSDMAELAERYPNISFFLDHAGRNFACAESYAALAKKYDNVYLQLTYTSVPEGLIEYLCREGLADKTFCRAWLYAFSQCLLAKWICKTN